MKIPTILFLLWFSSALIHFLPSCANLQNRPSGHINHLALFWLKNPNDPSARTRLIQASHQFAEIPGIVSVSTGTPLDSNRPVVDSSYDLAILMTFESKDALQKYLQHPMHKSAVSDIVEPLVKKLLVYDFDTYSSKRNLPISETNFNVAAISFDDVFQEICSIMKSHFYHPNIIRDKLPSMRKKYREKIKNTQNKKDFSALINELLNDLQTSHTTYLTPSDFEYYHLSAVFSAIPEIKKLHNNQEVLYPTIGVITERVQEKSFIACVLPGSVADRAGLLKGDEIQTVDGNPYSQIDAIKNQVGKKTKLIIQRKPNGNTIRVSLVPVLMNPKKELLEAQKASIRLIERQGKKIGYIHILSYAGYEYHQELMAAISWGRLKDADALIIDLRYGLGGASPSYLNIFDQNIPAIHFFDRNQKMQVSDSQWRKPAVYLINHATRSGKELLVHVAKKRKLATLIGETTAGAATGGRLFPLRNRGLLYLAVNIAQVEGDVLEGSGIVPDIHVPVDIRYCGGKDVQLDQAIEFLSGKLLDTDAH